MSDINSSGMSDDSIDSLDNDSDLGLSTTAIPNEMRSMNTQINRYSEGNIEPIWENDSEISNADSAAMQSIYTLEDAITYLDFGPYQWYLMFISSFLWFAAAIQLMLASVLLLELEDLSDEWDLSNNYTRRAILTAIPFVGEIFGAYLMGMFSDLYGRRNTIIWSAVLLALFSTLSAIAIDYSMLVLMRMMVGFAVGGALACLSLFAEFTPKDIRGEMSFVQVSSWSLGAIFAVAAGWSMYDAGLGWRLFLGVCSIPCWLSIITAVMLPESPRWLLNNGENEAVIEQLALIGRWNSKNMEIVTGYLENHHAVDSSHKGKLGKIFSSDHRMTAGLVLTATPMACAAYFGVALFQLSYFEAESDTTNAIFWEILVCTSSELPGMIFGILMFEHVGRIPFLTSTFGISSLCFLGLIFASEAVGIALIFVARMCVSLAYNILIVYMLEYFPTTVRATALGFAITEARIAAIAATFIAEGLQTNEASIVFAVCCAIATVCSYLLPVETLGRELDEDFQDELYDQVEDMDDDLIEQTLEAIMDQNKMQRAMSDSEYLLLTKPKNANEYETVALLSEEQVC